MRSRSHCETCDSLPDCLFSSFEERELQNIFSWLTSIQLPRNTTIYHEGLPADGVYVLCCGTVKLLTVSDGGMRRIAGLLSRGEMFGLDSLLPGRQRVFTAMTRERCELCFIDRDRFVRLLRSTPDFLWRLTNTLNLSLHKAQRLKLSISGDRVRNRLYTALVECNNRDLHLKQIELAEIVGVSPETVNRELHKMRLKRGTSYISGRFLADAE